jgi:hypothetical protein
MFVLLTNLTGMYPITNIVFVSIGRSDEESHGEEKEGFTMGAAGQTRRS